MANTVVESERGVLRLDFDRRLTLQFRGSAVASDAGLLAYRELDDALGLAALAGEMVAPARTGNNGRHDWSVCCGSLCFGHLAGYDDVKRCPNGCVTIRRCRALSPAQDCAAYDIVEMDQAEHRSRL